MAILDRALQAQESVVGSMLIDDHCIPLVLSELTPDDFTDGTCRATFTAIRKLAREGRPVDIMTVVDAMQGGDRYIAWARDVMKLTPTAANVGEYIPMVRKAARRRHILEMVEDLHKADDEQLEALVRRMSSMLSATERMPRMTGPERSADFVRRMRDPEKPKYLPWGIPTADRAVYAELGDMILLGGYASSGKTLLSISMAQAQARAGYKVGYYSLETSPRKMTDRQMAALSGVPLGRLKKRDFSESEWTKFAQAANRVATEFPFDVIHAAGSTVDDITADAVGRGYQVIYVDYVQELRVDGMRPDNPRIVVTEISQRLKRFAQSTGTAVVALAQLARPDTVIKKTEGAAEKLLVPPTMHSFKESGQLEQDADVAFLIWPKIAKDNGSNRMFQVGKNKEGPRPKTELVFHGDTQTMVELEPEEDHSVAAELSARGRAVKRANRAKVRQGYQEVAEGPTDNPFEDA